MNYCKKKIKEGEREKKNWKKKILQIILRKILNLQIWNQTKNWYISVAFIFLFIF